ncbi:MAG: hypothetical protein LC808_21305, partial [Actinobacteria bacterium]|nr:hypothetical protein [Actinomycetota bacterium]
MSCVDVQVIPYLVVHVFPWWLAVDVLPGLGWVGQGWWVDDLADLAGEMVGGGSSESDGDGDLV